MNREQEKKDILKSLEQEIDFKLIQKAGLELKPAPGTYIIFLLTPVMDKATSKVVKLPEYILFDPSRIVEWSGYSSYHPTQGMILTAGDDLQLADGRNEPNVYQVGDIVYLLDIHNVGTPVIHGGYVMYYIHQRNIICKVNRDDTYEKENKKKEGLIIKKLEKN